MTVRTTLFAALSAFALTSPALADGVEVHDAYAITSGAMAQSGAAFMVIHNHGGPADRLLAARSDVAARTELHTHVQNSDGVMQMIEVEEGFDLPTDGEIVMERGGHHVMFLGLTAPLEDGQVIPVTLVFETAGDVVVDVTVDLDRAGGAAMDHGDHGSHDTGHGG